MLESLGFSGAELMKLSHVIVAIVFFILGALAVLIWLGYFDHAPAKVSGAHSKQTAQGGTSIGIGLGLRADKPAAKPASPAVSATPKISFRIEQDVNRHGSDYRDFEMAAKDGYEVCRKACADDTKCLAFTFVKGGVQGTAPHCWLKNTVPQAYPDNSCVSGIRQ